MGTRTKAVAAFMTSVAGWTQLTSADELTKWTLDDLLTGRATGGVMKIIVNDEDILKFTEGGFKVSIFDKRNEVSAYSDPQFLDCANNAGLPYIFKTAVAGAAAYAGQYGVIEGLVVEGAGEGGISLLSLKSYSDCVANWTARVDGFVAEQKPGIAEMQVGEITPETAAASSNILQNRSGAGDVKLVITDASGRKEVSVGDLKKSLAENGEKTVKAIEALTEEIRKANKDRESAAILAQRREEIRREFQAKRDAIAGGAAVLSLLGRIAFADDPVAASRIESGVSSVAQIADSIVQLSGPNPLSDGAKVLLSANIASGALALVSLIGSKNSESAVLMRQLQGIQTQISSLKKEMHGRFDRLEQIITEVARHFDARLDTIDQRLIDIAERLEALANDTENIYELSRESFRHLVSAEYKSSIRRCSRPISRDLYSKESALKCFDDVIDYALEVAPLRVMSSGSLYDPNAGPDEAMAAAAELPPLVRLGYLDAALRYAKRKGINPNFDVPISSIVSPPDWADAVDIFSAYLANVDEFKALADGGYTREKLLSAFAGDVEVLVDQGQRAKDYVTKIRLAGVPFALDRYRVKTEALLTAFAEEVLSDLRRQDLGILRTDREVYADLRGNTDVPFATGGDMRYSIKFFDVDRFVVNQGPEINRVWRTKKQSSSFWQMGTLMPGHAESAVLDHFNKYIRDASNYANHTFTLDYDTKLVDHTDHLHEVNDPYLQAVSVEELTTAGKASLYKAFSRARSAPKVVEACQKVSQANRVVSMYAELLRTTYSELDSKWQIAAADLPGADAQSLCAGLSLPSKSIDEQHKVADYIVVSDRAKFSASIEALKSAFLSADQNAGIDSIDVRLGALRAISQEANVLSAAPR